MELVKTSSNQNVLKGLDKKIVSTLLDCSEPLPPPASYEKTN